ncbi:putative diguanylate cyclase YedQ [Thiorhodovibrio winogradskyi]|uniref:diguanylate cyclase n=1 Tax=Thiorhodovibrio winogradskyi TaxID=77007 RepID=A0ABZ0S7Y4_9GAMM|nr:diguanylate cyclase [Thiorhodovibrio winogradskyi]
MQLRLINRERLAVFVILLLGYAAFGPLLFGLNVVHLEFLGIFTLLNLVAIHALLPFFMPWMAERDIREIQSVLTGLKQGNFRVPIKIAPEPHDPDDENELNRLKRDIERMRAGIRTREEMVYRQSERILALNESMRREAITDRLTGLYNSRYFWERMDASLAYSRRHGAAFAVVILDIDFFKEGAEAQFQPGDPQTRRRGALLGQAQRPRRGDGLG